jgi:purine catabolism regulator
MSEAGRLFQGGELLLTQGRGIGRSTAQQTKWIDDLASAGVAGVAVETGVVWPEIPRSVVDQAAKRSIPLIALKHPAYFMKMTRAVHSAIISSHYDALMHAEELGRRLSRLAMAGASLQAAMDELSSAMGHPLVLSDRAHQVEAYAPRNELTLGMIKNWQAHARQGHDYSGQASSIRVTFGDVFMSCSTRRLRTS